MENLISFMDKVGKLKNTQRKGWVERGIQNAESVADHSFGIAILAMILSTKADVDENKVIKMALIHDLAEAIVGDITPKDNVSSETKFKMESEAFESLCSNINNGNELFDLWKEFESGETKEAQFIKRLDKLEMMFQAHKYNTDQPEINLEDFWENRKGYDFKESSDVFENLKIANLSLKNSK